MVRCVISGPGCRGRWGSLGVCVLLILPIGSSGPGREARGGEFRPEGKSFKERLMAFLADAKETHGVTVSRKAEFRKAEDAQKSGKLKDEIVPVTIKSLKGYIIVDTDEYPRHGATLE